MRKPSTVTDDRVRGWGGRMIEGESERERKCGRVAEGDTTGLAKDRY